MMRTRNALGTLCKHTVVGALVAALLGCATEKKDLSLGSPSSPLFAGGRSFPFLGGSSPKSPIMVRGGAMTFTSTAVISTLGTDSTHPCFGLVPNYVELIDVAEEVSSGIPVAFLPDAYFVLSGTWSVTLYARNPDGTVASTATQPGVVVTNATACTVGGNPVNGIALSPAPSSTSSFYSPNTNLDDSSTSHSVRFKNTNNCNSATTDQDACESIGTIVISSSSSTYRFRCLRASCQIGFGSL